MATYSGARVVHATIAATTEDTVTLTTPFRYVRVYNRGSGDLFFTVDNTAITSAGQLETYVVPANSFTEVFNPVPLNEKAVNLNSQVVTVRLYSAGTPAYTVQGI